MLLNKITKNQKPIQSLSHPSGCPNNGVHRRQLRTTNMLERVNKEVKRRTRVATLFPNEASLLRLVTAILMEISEEWETGKIYLNLKE